MTRHNKTILIIPDVHGRQFWKKAVGSGDYDKVVFLGDYLDPYPDERIGELTAQHNFEDILSYYDQHPDKVVLLLGNHDLHYLSPHYHDICPSGRYNEQHSDYYRFLFTQKDRFRLGGDCQMGRISDGQHHLERLRRVGFDRSPSPCLPDCGSHTAIRRHTRHHRPLCLSRYPLCLHPLVRGYQGSVTRL